MIFISFFQFHYIDILISFICVLSVWIHLRFVLGFGIKSNWKMSINQMLGKNTKIRFKWVHGTEWNKIHSKCEYKWIIKWLDTDDKRIWTWRDVYDAFARNGVYSEYTLAVHWLYTYCPLTIHWIYTIYKLQLLYTPPHAHQHWRIANAGGYCTHMHMYGSYTHIAGSYVLYIGMYSKHG